ncbi:MAG: dipeptidyl aminopeptidase/acylaminoacyl peptidase [Alphaproteobacteria bacterium]|jgi:dipeptidyl aminopeptidase/acylaminoacyl peptidase
MDYNDVFNMEFASNPQFHPSGDFIVYERVSMDKFTDRQVRQLWRLELESNRHAPLLPANTLLASSYSPIFSSDGKKLMFLSSTNKGIQIFVYWLDTKDLIQVSQLEASPSELVWSPDNKRIAFTMFTPEAGKTLFNSLPKAPKGASWSAPAIFIDDVIYRGDGAGYLEKGFRQIYTISAQGGNANQLSIAKFNHDGPLAWTLTQTKDEAPISHIYFSSNQTDNWEMHPFSANIFAIDTVTQTQIQVTELAGPESSVGISPNGKYLAFLHINDRKLSYQVNQIMLMSLATKEITALTPKLDRQIQSMQWQASSKGLVFTYADTGKTKIASVSRSGKITKLSPELGSQALGRPYISGEFTVSKDNLIVYTPNNPQSPAELALHHPKSKRKSTLLTSLNADALERIEMANTNAMSIKSSIDGLNVDAWIAYPPGFDDSKTYPLILEIHGGPHAAYGDTFSLEIQLMAAKGYVVVWSNPRGSSSYGEDFGNTIHHNYPSNDYQDLMDVVDAVIAKGFINTKALFVTGGSGGGVLTAWTVGKTDRFAAAVVAKPVINWLSFTLTADAYPYFSQYWMPGKPWEVQDHLWKHSPLSLVGNVSTPTMLLTGEDDYRTPISETEQYYQALKLAGVPTAMVRIPDAGHGIASRPTRLMQKVGNILAWFERYKTLPE